jgi:hypothetical protein
LPGETPAVATPGQANTAVPPEENSADQIPKP